MGSAWTDKEVRNQPDRRPPRLEPLQPTAVLRTLA
jgi:hypothetical protein